MSDDTMKALLEYALAETAKNGLLAKYIAEQIGKRPDVLDQVWRSIPPEVLGKALASHIMYISDSKRRSSYATGQVSMSKIMTEAREMARQQLADAIEEKIRNEVAGV